MSKPRYKDRLYQGVYEALLKLAADPESELYWKGAPRRGASHRCAFWDGFSGKYTLTGKGRSAAVIPGTLSAVAFQAGREWARRLARLRALTNSGKLFSGKEGA